MKELFHFSGWIRPFVNLGTVVAPGLSVRICHELLSRPQRLKIRNFQYPLIHKASGSLIKIESGKKIKVWRWKGRGPRVLFCHGWSGNGLQFWRVIEALIQEGFDVVTFDHQAHGESEGKQATLLNFNQAVVEIDQLLGAFDIYIAHSMGALSLTSSGVLENKTAKLILLSPVPGIEEISTYFFQKYSLGEKLLSNIRKTTETMLEVNWSDFSLKKFSPTSDLNLYIIHDKMDQEVPLKLMMESIDHIKGFNRFFSSGLGHYRILYSKKILGLILDHLCIQKK